MNENELRNKLLIKINDLKNKIETSEPCPEMEQDAEFLVELHDRIDECLSAWYY